MRTRGCTAPDLTRKPRWNADVPKTMASEKNVEALTQLARDLRREDPRSPEEQLGGFELAARALDKCRASLLGWSGEYQFNCPMDREFFAESGIDADEFRDYVATGASDEEVGNWIEEHAARTRM